MNLEEFLAHVDQLPATMRARRLARLDAYYRGEQYADRRLDVGGYWKSTPGVYGSMSRTPGWDERDPGAVWNLTKECVDEITDWALSGDSWCHLEVADDHEAEDWLGTVAQMACMSDVIAQARNYGGAQGTAIVSFAWRDGEPTLEAHAPRHCWPLSWRDERRHRPAEVVCVYRGDDALAEKDDELPLFARVWDEQREALFMRERGQKGEPRWREVSSVVHGLGLCPVYWHPQLAGAGAHDGSPDGEGAEGEVDDANELFAAASCTTKRNADDTLVVREDPALNPGKVRKGGFNTIFARGGAEYLSQTGESARVCVELGERRAAHVYRRYGVVMVDAEQLGRATTGEALKRLFQRTLKTAGRIRRDYARGLIIPLCKGLLASARILRQRGLPLAIPPRVSEDERLGAVRIEQRTPGTSSFVQCVWPDAFQPTLDDQSKLVAAAVAGTGNKQVLSQRSAIAWLKGSPIPISNIEEELERIEHDAKAAAEAQAKSLGLGQEHGGKAGRVEDDEKQSPQGDDEGDDGGDDEGDDEGDDG